MEVTLRATLNFGGAPPHLVEIETPGGRFDFKSFRKRKMDVPPAPHILEGVISTAKKTLIVAKKFLVSDLGKKIEATHGQEKFDAEIKPVLDVIIAVNDHVRVSGTKDLVNGPLAEIYSGDYYGDIVGDQALSAFTSEVAALEVRMQTRGVENFYD